MASVLILCTLCIFLIFYTYGIDAAGIFSKVTDKAKGYPLTPSSVPRGQKKQDICGFVGNSDIYGLGVRMGYYFQSFAVWWAGYFVHHEVKYLRSTNILFFFVMSTALILTCNIPTETHSIEIFLLLQLIFTVWLVGAKENSKWIETNWNVAVGRILVREASKVGILGINVWYWWHGLDLFKETPCGTYIFFYYKATPYGTVRAAQRVISIIALIWGVIVTCGHAAQLIEHWQTRWVRTPGYFKDIANQLREECEKARIGIGSSSGIFQDRVTSSKTFHGYSEQVHHLHAPESQSVITMPPDTEVDYATSKHSFSEAASNFVPDPSQLPKLQSQHSTTSTSGEPSLERLPSLPSSSCSPKTPLTTFSSLLAAEMYLADVVETFPSTAHVYSFPLLYIWNKQIYVPIIVPSIRIFFPALPAPLPSITSTSIRFSLLIRTFSYLYAQRTYPVTSYFSLFLHAISSKHYQTVNRDALVTYLLLQPRLPMRQPSIDVSGSSTLSNSKTLPIYSLWAEMTYSLFLQISLILALELSINWNRITEVQSMKAVGQLVPFMLGLGGLLKVLWSFARLHVQRFHPNSHTRKEDEDGDIDECAGIFSSLKDFVFLQVCLSAVLLSSGRAPEESRVEAGPRLRRRTEEV